MVKCPECGHEFENEESDETIARHEFIKSIVSDINHEDKKGFLTEADRALLKSGIFKT